MGSSSHIGVIISLISSTTLNVGVNVQKYSHNANSKLAVADQRSPFRQPMWLIGLFVFVLGNIGDFIALGFTAQSILAPLGSISLVTNAILAPLMHGENFSRRDLNATILIVLGAVTVVLSGSTEETEYDLDELVDLYSQPLFILYIVFVLAFIAFLYASVKYLEKEKKNPYCTRSARSSVEFYLAPAYATLGAVIGSLTTLTAKSASEMLQTSLDGDNQFTKPLAWVVVFVMIFSSVAQVHWINVGLMHYDALFVIPVFYVAWTVFGVLGGSIYFGEFSGLSPLQLFFFFAGILLNFTGVRMLMQRRVEFSEWRDIRVATKEKHLYLAANRRHML